MTIKAGLRCLATVAAGAAFMLAGAVSASPTSERSDGSGPLIRQWRFTQYRSEDGTGVVTTDIAGIADFADAIALQPDGAVVLAGRVSDEGGGGFFGLARYTPDGRLDGAFGAGGTTIADFGHGGIAHAVTVLPDGKLLVVGDALSDFAVARFDSRGDLDPTFGGDGLTTTDLRCNTTARSSRSAPRTRVPTSNQDFASRHLMTARANLGAREADGYERRCAGARSRG